MRRNDIKKLILCIVLCLAALAALSAVVVSEITNERSLREVTFFERNATPVVTSAENVPGGVQVTWNAYSGAGAYRVFYKASDDTSWKKAGDTSGTSFTITGLDSGTFYDFTVRCIDIEDADITSTCVSSETGAADIAEPDFSTAAGIKISSDISDSTSSFRIFRRSFGKNDQIIPENSTGVNYTGISVEYVERPGLTGADNVNGGVKITWEASSGAGMYEVLYRASGTDNWTSAGLTGETEYTVTGLSSGTKYDFTVRCVDTETGKAVTRNAAAKCFTYIEAPVLTGAVNTDDGVELSWNACGGAVAYRVFYRMSGSDEWIEAGDTTDTVCTIAGLYSNITYEFTVRCVDHPSGTEYTSAYDTEGLSLLREGDPYIAETDGSKYLYTSDGEIYSSYSGLYTYLDTIYKISGGVVTGTTTGDEAAMYEVAQKQTSATNYLILINKSTFRLGVYQWINNCWQEIRYVTCSIGAASTPTVEGTFTVSDQWYYFDSDNVRVFYPTRFYGAYWIHSILYTQTDNPETVVDSRLGYMVSHGCVRVSLADAKYINQNIPKGTTVYIYH